MSLKRHGLLETLGKTITGVVTSQDNESGPRSRLYLVFSDDTYYEIYSDHLHSAGGTSHGDVDSIARGDATGRGKYDVMSL